MPTPLNPALYTRLQEEFGYVATAHAGVAANVRYGPDAFSDKIKLQLTSSGEYYRVNCPYCNDSRARLWINHIWGVRDEVTGTANLWAAICYNENCLDVSGRLSELHERLYGFKNVHLRGKPVVILKGEVEEPILCDVGLPGVVIPIDKLIVCDPVAQYLTSRGYDLTELTELYSVSYCLNANSNYTMANDRIVIPIIMRNMLVGWQCRYAGDINWKSNHIPKYYSRPNMPKRLMLYNYDNAIKFPFVVLAEGPTDVWNIGPYGVAMFGKKPSTQQLQLLAEGWENGPIFIMLDGDAWEDTQITMERLKQQNYKGLIIPIQLPVGKDPGDYTFEYLAGCIITFAGKYGIDLTQLARSDNVSTKHPVLPYRCTRSGDGSTRQLDAGEQHNTADGAGSSTSGS